MKKLASTRRARKGGRGSNAEAVGVAPCGTPGDEHGSPHGLNVRLSYLTLGCTNGRWRVVRVDELGDLRIPHVVDLACPESGSLREAAIELWSWMEGTGLPAADYNGVTLYNFKGEPVGGRTIYPTADGPKLPPDSCDPVAGWPL